MQIDNLPKPCTFYYEDVEGNNIPFEFADGFPDKKWHAQHSKFVQVNENICFGSNGSNKKDLWPVKVIKWILDKMPASWKKPQISMSFESTINCCYPIIKYLVENIHWSFNEAAVAASDLCERCLNIALWQIEGDTTAHAQYLSNSRTRCDSCKYIDPDYYSKQRVKACYKAMSKKENIKKAFKNA